MALCFFVQIVNQLAILIVPVARKYVCVGRSVMSDFLQPHELEPIRLLCPWNSPGKKTGVGFHFLLQGIFLNQRSNLPLLHGMWFLYCWATRKPHQIILSLLHLGHSALGKFILLKGQLYGLQPLCFCAKVIHLMELLLQTLLCHWFWQHCPQFSLRQSD